jgi:hypothetical protein
VRLGDLVGDQEVTVALAVSCAAHLRDATAFVDCRVTDRNGALYQEPMRVEWRSADAAHNERQPVNDAVLVTVAEVLTARARTTALAANRRGDFAEAARVLRDIITHVRGLAPGHPQIEALVQTLRRDEGRLDRAQPRTLLKSLHFESYAASRSREQNGRARRRR